MTVNAFKLENFMAFKDSGWIRLRPICMLFGRNSSGKSALIRALRLLKQSVRCYPGPFVFNQPFGVNLGGYDTVIHAYDPKLPLIFHFRCSIEDNRYRLATLLTRFVQIDDPEAKVEEENIKDIEYTVGFFWDRYENLIRITQVQLDCSWEVEGITSFSNLFSATWLGDHAGFYGDNWHFSSNIFQMDEDESDQTIWSDVEIELDLGFLPELSQPPVKVYTPLAVDQYNLVSDLMKELRTDITRFIDGITYLGPLRPEPVREYVLTEQEQRRWEALGWGAYVQFLSNTLDEPKSKEIDTWVDHLDLFNGVRVNRKDAFSTFVSQVEVENEAFRVNLADVGFGVSQVLPIIVQSVLAAPNSLTIIEQPELHLHPAAQVELMDLFVQISSQFNRRFLLETHSEMLILRLQKKIRSGMVSPESGRVYFIDRKRDTDASTVKTMELDKKGRITTSWPYGFFEEGYKERFAEP